MVTWPQQRPGKNVRNITSISAATTKNWRSFADMLSDLDLLEESLAFKLVDGCPQDGAGDTDLPQIAAMVFAHERRLFIIDASSKVDSDLD